ncbi:Mediator-associated protein 1 [Dendrobium catenatum]|uniref:Mediator-associated protein 1 n=2 Tax=Dendrobium catenatum TaxID=906689 RepID=A0A2I0VCF4_9ASPA|nr:Mediator-associated protein 1 [Dendrobium catenatum]
MAKENAGPQQPRDSQNLYDDKQASDTPSSSGSGLGDDEEDIETPISDALLVPLSCKPVDSSVQPAEKEPNSGKQSAASATQISKKKRTADIVGVVGDQEKEHFRRIWSNEDELALLQGIMEYKEQHRIIPYTHTHAESLLKSVKDLLSISVSVNQINNKVRRLKRRYINTSIRQNLAKKSKFSDPHNAAAFDLSKKIWDSLKEESIFLEKKIMLEKKENFNKKKVGLKHIEEEYPSLNWHLRNEHANNALLLQKNMPIANAKKWEERCKKLEMIDFELNMQKIEFLSAAVKLIKDALAKC